jgi:hypothetical protein
LSDGRSFQEPASWRRYLERVVNHQESLPWFGIDGRYDYDGEDRLLGQLYEDLHGTGADLALADAALAIIEDGPLEHAKQVVRIASFILEAPNALDRVVALLEDDRERLEEAHLMKSILWNAASHWPDDSRLRDVVIREAERAGEDRAIIDAAAAAAPEWLAAHLPPLTQDSSPYRWACRAPRSKRKLLLDAIAAAGPGYVERTIAPILSAPAESARRELAAEIDWHPVFAKALASAATQSYGK